MNYTLPSGVKNIIDKFQKAGFAIYIVGGAVRDLLLNGQISDWDFTTDAKPEEILKLFPEGIYGNRFGTVIIPKKGLSYDKDRDKSLFEITTMRKEGRYEDFRHPGAVSWTNKIGEDLARRDFTINAMALGEKLIDPFNGQQDIKDRIIRAVGDPNQRFQEDALRLMRAVRIATELEFDIEKDTLEAIKKNKELIKEIAWERIRDELLKLLASMYGYMGTVKLREAGILQIILPELEACFGIVQEGPKHDRIYDIGEHSLLSLKHCPSKDPLVRPAALLHDIGKVETVKTAADGNVTFYNHDVTGGHLALKIAKRFNLSRKQSDKLFRLVRWHLFTVDERQTDSAIRRFITNVGKDSIDDMMAVRIGDRLGGGTQKAISWRMEEFQKRIKEVLKKPFSISDLKVNGNDVMKTLNIKPGPKVGEILNKLFEEVLENSSKNNKDYLVKRISDLIAPPTRPKEQ